MTGRDESSPTRNDIGMNHMDMNMPRAFFGRRVGQPLRFAQSRLFDDLLPRLKLPEGQLPNLESLFSGQMHEVRLEIGFGGAEHLIAAAVAEPDVGFIGVEPFVNGLAKALSAIDIRKLENIRLWDDDASHLLKRIPDQSLARVDLFYPDPWPKRRQRKRRFVTDEILDEIARVLKPGCCFRFATDIDDYAGWTLARLLRSKTLSWTGEAPLDWLTPLDGWVRTRYEAKAIIAQRIPSYITAIRL